jgi:EmrB/QacA subfamily drug resistance transporter
MGYRHRPPAYGLSERKEPGHEHSDRTTPRQRRARQRASRWLILALVLAAQFMVTLGAMVVNVALPSIQAALHFGSASSLQWVVNAYTLLFGGFLMVGGRMGDLLGRQRLFIVGLALFTAASLVNGIAQSSAMLVAGRGVQGLGAALVSPAVLSIIMVTFADERERGRALGLFGAVMAAGGATGLLLGGVLTSELSWRWIFYVNLPIGVLAVLAALYYVPNTRAGQRPESADVAGAASVTAGLVLLVYVIVNAQQWHWASGKTLGLLAAAAALLAAFVLIELRSRQPLVRLGIFAKRTLSAASGTAFLFMPGLFVTMFFPSLYLQEVLGYSPVKTGAAFLPFPLTMTVFALGGQRLIRRTGVRPPLVTGLLLAAASLLFLFGRIPVHGSYTRDVLPALVVMAIGTGLALPTIILVATSNVHSNEAGLASGIVNSSQQIGGALGLAVLATIAAAKTASMLPMAGGGSAGAGAMVDGFQLGFTAAGAFLLAAALLAGLFIRRADVEHLKAAPEPAATTARHPA